MASHRKYFTAEFKLKVLRYVSDPDCSAAARHFRIEGKKEDGEFRLTVFIKLKRMY